MIKLLAAAASVLASLGLAGFFPPPPPDDEPPPPPRPRRTKKAKRRTSPSGRASPVPRGTSRAYDLLRRLRADGGTAGRPEERLRDWTERATKLYRDGVKAHEARRPPRWPTSTAPRRTTWPGPSTTPATPPATTGPTPTCRPARGSRARGRGDRVRRDLTAPTTASASPRGRSRSRVATFYLDAASDLYNAARRDAEAGRQERAGELARAAEAMTHVAEHLGHAAVAGPNDQPEPKRLRPAPSPSPDLKRERDRDLGPARPATPALIGR